MVPRVANLRTELGPHSRLIVTAVHAPQASRMSGVRSTLIRAFHRHVSTAVRACTGRRGHTHVHVMPTFGASTANCVTEVGLAKIARRMLTSAIRNRAFTAALALIPSTAGSAIAPVALLASGVKPTSTSVYPSRATATVLATMAITRTAVTVCRATQVRTAKVK